MNNKKNQTLEEEMFAKFDTNGDGKISSTELAAVLNGLGTATSVEEIDRIMAELDQDGDGFIDLEEFKAFQCQEASNKELREAFNVYDKDGNGKITASELQVVLKSLGENCSMKDCKRMISSVDVDGDGCVDFEEFKKMMSRS